MTLARARGLAALVALLLVVAGCAAGPPAPASPAPAASVAMPTWVVGDRWVYDWTSGRESGTKTIEVVELREVNKVRYYIVRVGASERPGDSDAEHYYTEALAWAAAVRGGKVETRMVPAQPWFAWPLVPSKRWTHQGRFEQREGVTTHNDRFTVVGAEPVEVPAGRYQAVKVTRDTDRRDGDEYWYASAVRWYARWLGRRGDSQFEELLREYRPAPRPR